MTSLRSEAAKIESLAKGFDRDQGELTSLRQRHAEEHRGLIKTLLIAFGGLVLFFFGSQLLPAGQVGVPLKALAVVLAALFFSYLGHIIFERFRSVRKLQKDLRLLDRYL